MQKLHNDEGQKTKDTAAIRRAEADMRYLGRAWRLGWYGPRETPQATSMWQQIKQQVIRVPVFIDDARVNEIHARWLEFFIRDAYNATILKVYYRDHCEFEDEELLEALKGFSRT